jgi:hypothetical protein
MPTDQHEAVGQSLDDADPRSQIMTALRVLFRPGQVVELRVPNHPRGNATTAGYFDRHDMLAEWANGLSGKAPGVYVTLNEIDPALLARVCNRVEEWAKQTTTDADVQRRRWLPLDFDPVRPSGVPSTEAEHAAALARAESCRSYLNERGWPEGILADSGNGAHLLYAIDLPNDEASKGLVAGCLLALAQRFSDGAVGVDRAVGNAARIWKVYGTTAAKGDGTADRPHRQARMVNVPTEIIPVPVERLEALAATVEEDAPSKGTQHEGNGRSRLNVPRWLEARGVAYRVKQSTSADDRTVYRITCPFNSSHTDASVMQDAAGGMSAHCFHDSCNGKGWADFKAKIGPPGPEHYDPPLGTAAAGGNTGIKIIAVTPPVLGEAAYLGFVGDFLRAVAPYTEATDAGILAHLLPTVGTLVGPHVHVWAGSRQPARINTVLVGPTSTGRKGTSFAPVDLLMRLVGEAFWTAQRVNGLSSGEGLVAYVADKEERNLETKEMETIPVEKRLYVVEEEFSKVLAQGRRDGNILSQILRECFDSGNLAVLTRNNPLRAYGAHVSITGHITPEELLSRLNHIEMANGFGNRFLWFVVKSNKIMPHTKPIPESVFKPFTTQPRALLFLGSPFCKRGHSVRMDAAATALWETLYPRLREDRPGLVGAMISRRSAMVLRLALTYALLDCKLGKLFGQPCPELKRLAIRVEHLQSALAIWDYSEASAQMLFGGKIGDPLGEKLLHLLAAGPMTRDEFNKHLSVGQKAGVGAALAKLEAAGLVRRVTVKRDGPGRPAEQWERA